MFCFSLAPAQKQPKKTNKGGNHSRLDSAQLDQTMIIAVVVQRIEGFGISAPVDAHAVADRVEFDAAVVDFWARAAPAEGAEGVYLD